MRFEKRGGRPCYIGDSNTDLREDRALRYRFTSIQLSRELGGKTCLQTSV